jgi:hypothetical protein
MRSDIDPHRILERAIAVSQRNYGGAIGVISGIRDHEIRLAVSIEVANCNPDGIGSDIHPGLGVESAVAVPQQQPQAWFGWSNYYEEVKMMVVIDIGDGDLCCTLVKH